MLKQQWYSIMRRTTGERSRSSFAAACLCAAIVCIASGCRSGATAFSAPSWWSFGGSGADSSKLASAPPFDGQAASGKIEKPSQSATPYPTTTTPNGYVVNDSTRGQPADPTAPATAAAVPAAVTYGTTPPPTAQAPVGPTGTSLSSIAPQTDPPRQPAPSAGGPQVGPYASLSSPVPTPGNQQPLMPPPLSPAVSPSPAAPLAAGATPSAFPATAGYEPATRYASNAGNESFGQSPSAAVPPSADPAASSRYGSSMGSRFGGGIETPPAAPLAPLAAPATSPLATPVAPASPAFPSAPGMPATPPPARRPDPGYRPGGTSSYRPSRAILVDDQPSPPSAVRTAAYEVPTATSP